MKTSTVSIALFFGALMSLSLIAAPLTYADGCMISPWHQEIVETDQFAYLDFDRDAQQEDLYILPLFYGTASEFAWIVPTPSLPTLAEADVQLFAQLTDLTRPTYRRREDSFDCFGSKMYPDFAVSPGAQIISTETVGIYSASIISADDVSALTDSLTTWGFLSPENVDDVTTTLAHYVDRSWYFVAMRILQPDDPYDQPSYGWYGTLDPIRLSFATAEPVYPMRISALSASDNTRIKLFVNDDHRMTCQDARTVYANRLTSQEIADTANKQPLVAALLSPGDYLTKLELTMSASDMVEDLVVVQADSDDEYRRLIYAGFGGATTLLLLGMMIATARPWRRLRRTPKA